MIRCSDSVTARRWYVGLALAPLLVMLPAHAGTIDHIKKITAPDAAASNQFGRSVALNSVECFIGAPERAEGGIFASGASYFFGGNLGGVDNWGFAVKRNELAPGSADRMGHSVGMSANHSVAGVWGDDDNGTSSGAGYLYERNLGGIGAWGLRKKLVASDGVAHDNLGWAVDMDNGIVIMGARLKSNSQGAAYIFQENTGGANNWGQSKKLVAPIPEDSSFFGHAVAVHNGTAVVGAFQENAVAPNSGAVYVYEELPAGPPEAPGSRTGTWKLAKKIVAPDGGSSDFFGGAVAVQNGMVVVGATNHLDVSGGFGAVYLFHRNQGGAGNYGLVKKLVNVDTDNLGDSFGRSLALDDDILAVGVAQDGAPGASPGAVYVYGRDIGGADNWGVLTKVQAPDAEHFDLLGYDVDLVNDTFIAGAWSDDDDGGFSGSAHIFRINSICPADINGDGVVDTADLGTLIGSFGGSGPGDLNLDGVIDTADLGALIGGFGATDCAFGS